MTKENPTKIQQDKVMTAIVGSYPKPKDIFFGRGRELLDKVGMNFYDLEKEIGKKEFKKRLNRAVIDAINDQNHAGINLITDGEERRDHYVLYVLRKLEAFDFKNLRKKSIREGIYVRKLPTAVKKIEYKNPILIEDYKFTKKHANNIAKIGLPGPSTVVDSVADEYYNENMEKMAMDYAKAIRTEVKNLIDAGCQAIQFDDPVLLRYPERAKKWGLKALQSCYKGLENKALFLVHICRGYPHKSLEKKKIPYKAKADYYSDVLSWLSKSTIDVVSIEGAQSRLDLKVLPAIGEKTVMLGVLDVGTNKVETVKSIVKRGKEALEYLPKEQLILAPDCGMLQLTQKAAKNKLVNLAKAASILNR
ncbi:MAG: cobalamin-independent methionine synthase II family protein [Candidatus Hydrothermarchaeales archaeon]